MKLVSPFLASMVGLLLACDPVSAPRRGGSESGSRSRGTSDGQTRAGEDRQTEDEPSDSDLTSSNDPNERNPGRSLDQKDPQNRAISLVEIRPLIQKHCVRCHGVAGSRSDLTQDAQIVSRGSEIVRRTASKFNGMPSDNPKAVTDEEKDLLTQWKSGGYQR